MNLRTYDGAVDCGRLLSAEDGVLAWKTSRQGPNILARGAYLGPDSQEFIYQASTVHIGKVGLQLGAQLYEKCMNILSTNRRWKSVGFSCFLVSSSRWLHGLLNSNGLTS